MKSNKSGIFLSVACFVGDVLLVIGPAIIAFVLCSTVACGATGLYSFEQECQTGNCPITAGPASCVAIGQTPGGDVCILTAAHCVSDARNKFFAVDGNGDKHQCWVLFRDTDNDIASLICQANLTTCAVWTTTEPAVGEKITLRCVLSRRMLDSEGTVSQVSRSRRYARALWSHPGSSGGPWYNSRGYCCGIHCGKVVDSGEAIGCGGEAMGKAIEAFELRYGKMKGSEIATEQANCIDCRPGVIIRPQVRQPMLGIGIPVGPPQVQGVVTGYADPPPRQSQSVPQPQPQPQTLIAPCQDDLRRLVSEYMAANPPPAGPQGNQGPAGESVDPAAVVAAVMSQIRMPQDGQPGRDGVDGKSADPAEVARYLIANHRAEIMGARGVQGPPGNSIQGPIGPAGPAGPPPNDAQVAKAVMEIIAANPDRFRGPAGDSGPKGDRYVAIPDDEAFQQRVDEWLSRNPEVVQRYQQVPELLERLEAIEKTLTNKQPVNVLRSDGSLYSTDDERRLIDPIEIQLDEPK